MKTQTGIIFGLVTAAVVGVAPSLGSAKEVVEMRLPGHYYNEPATVQIIVSVEPDERNRVLRLEADGESFFRSTEQALSGAGEKRTHVIEFRSLPAGNYTVRAQVLAGGEDVRGSAVQQLVVAGR